MSLGFRASAVLERKTVKYKFNVSGGARQQGARIVFVLMTRGGQYDDRPVALNERGYSDREFSPAEAIDIEAADEVMSTYGKGLEARIAASANTSASE